jgi:hypothetical protein
MNRWMVSSGSGLASLLSGWLRGVLNTDLPAVPRLLSSAVELVTAVGAMPPLPGLHQ